MKARYILFIGGLLISAVSPHMSSAATRVSRQFDSDFYYFPQTAGAKVFSGGAFFESNDSTQANSWSVDDIDLDGIDGFSDQKAVQFKHHVYALAGYYHRTTQDFGLVSNRIVRMKMSSPHSLQTMKQLSTSVDDLGNTFTALVKFKGDLFAAGSRGALFRSHNGKHWHQINLAGLPADSDIIELVAGENTLYAIYPESIYTSTDGKSWTELNGSYQDDAYNGSLSVAEFNGKTYLASYSFDDKDTFVWQVGNRGNFTELFSKSSDVNYSLFVANGTLYLTGTDGTIRTLQNDQFQLIDQVNGIVVDITQTNDTTLFIVNNNDHVSLWK